METFLNIADKTYKVLLVAATIIFAKTMLEAAFHANFITSAIFGIGFGLLVSFILDTDFANPRKAQKRRSELIKQIRGRTNPRPPCHFGERRSHEATQKAEQLALNREIGQNDNPDATVITENVVFPENIVPTDNISPGKTSPADNTARNIRAVEIISDLPIPFIITAGLNALLFVILLGIQTVL